MKFRFGTSRRSSPISANWKTAAKTVLETIDAQGKLTPELRARIEAVLEKNELEDLYLPYKPKRRTKASIAREKGLEPLAQYLWDQLPASSAAAEYAATFVSADKNVGFRR